MDRRMNQKELAAYFGVCRQTIWVYKRRGFLMVAGSATPRELYDWWEKNGGSSTLLAVQKDR